MELDNLLELKKTLESNILDYFGDNENPNYSDRGYQDLLEELGAVNERITEIYIEEDEDNY